MRSPERTARKLLFQMKYLEEELSECSSIFEKAKLEFNNAIRQLHYDLNVFDSALDKNTDSPPQTSDHDSTPTVQEAACTSDKTAHPAWAKKIFREIVKETHPDHFPKNLRESRKKNLKDIYEKTVESYNKKSYSGLLETAFQLGIEVGDIDEDQISVIKAKIKFTKGEIVTIKNSLYWQWAHADDDMRQSILKKFIDMRGWTGSEANRKKGKKRSRKHPGKSIAWARKKFKNVSDIPSHDKEED